MFMMLRAESARVPSSVSSRVLVTTGSKESDKEQQTAATEERQRDGAAVGCRQSCRRTAQGWGRGTCFRRVTRRQCE
jgi:hypothetical protein